MWSQSTLGGELTLHFFDCAHHHLRSGERLLVSKDFRKSSTADMFSKALRRSGKGFWWAKTSAGLAKASGKQRPQRVWQCSVEAWLSPSHKQEADPVPHARLCFTQLFYRFKAHKKNCKLCNRGENRGKEWVRGESSRNIALWGGGGALKGARRDVDIEMLVTNHQWQSWQGAKYDMLEEYNPLLKYLITTKQHAPK